MTITCEWCRKSLDDHLDDRLSGRERALLETHLAECAACNDDIAAAVRLRAAARALPRSIDPPRDLWSGIAERVERSPREETASPVRGIGSAPSWKRWAPLAAAAVILVVVSSGLTTALLREPPSAEAGAAGGAAVPEAAAPVALAAFEPMESEYRTTVAALQAELAARRDFLDPVTVQVIETNLLIIDQAIAEARRALAADPSSAHLPLHLSDIYRQKVELLRSAAQIRI
jgi:anti-sigma factor RsiW